MTIPPVTARRETVRNRYFVGVEEDLHTDTGSYTYNFIECNYDAVIVVPVLPDGRLVVERIYRHPYHAYVHEFPAGGINHGEDPVAAAGRELTEETGFQAGKLELLGSFEVMPGLMTMRLSVVLATDLVQTGTRALEALELLEVHHLTEAEAWAIAETQPASSFLTHGLLYLGRHVRKSGSPEVRKSTIR
jgi:8-oxo-dGTP pyrophosphatase MutT (NUDIX family)